MLVMVVAAIAIIDDAAAAEEGKDEQGQSENAFHWRSPIGRVLRSERGRAARPAAIADSVADLIRE
jgi:hypothetical protein